MGLAKEQCTSRRKEPACTNDDNDTIEVGEERVRFLVEAADSNGSASVFECTSRPLADAGAPQPRV